MPAPMMTGPTIREPLTSAPCLDDDPSDDLARASTVPSHRGSMLSSTIRFTSSMSATLPVSFQYPVIVVDRTLRPWSMSHWIASVISSSPRHDGFELPDRVMDGGVKM